jgi:hypothetical protein
MQTDEYGSTFKETTIKEDKISRSGAKIAQTCAATILKIIVHQKIQQN